MTPVKACTMSFSSERVAMAYTVFDFPLSATRLLAPFLLAGEGWDEREARRKIGTEWLQSHYLANPCIMASQKIFEIGRASCRERV